MPVGEARPERTSDNLSRWELGFFSFMVGPVIAIYALEEAREGIPLWVAGALIMAAAVVGGMLQHKSWSLRGARVAAYTVAGLGALYTYWWWYVGPKVEPDPFIASTYFGIKLAVVGVVGALPGLVGGEIAVRLLRRRVRGP